MKNLVLDLVASCENRISMIEELVTGAHYATATLDESLGELTDESAGLRASLQEMLARHCSLRRKDFNALMERIISESERRRGRLEEERRSIRAELGGYLDEQKRLLACLWQQLDGFDNGHGDRDALENTTASIKTIYRHKGQQVLAMLRGFQLHLEAFQKEQKEMNRELRRLVERGQSLRLEDLRQLGAAKAGQERKVERELRRQDVERLLAHFKGQRQEGNHNR